MAGHTGMVSVRVQVKEQPEDVHVFEDTDGVVVVATKPGLLSDRAVRAMNYALGDPSFCARLEHVQRTG